MAATSRSTAFETLHALLGDRWTTAADARELHAHDVSHHAPRLPDGVAFPQCVNEISQIVAVCAEHRIPVIPFGTGTAVEGGVIPLQGGVSIDLSRMNRILAVSTAGMDARVEAGVTRHQLNAHLESLESGLFFPVDPGADASLGGMAATRASGSAAVRYGTMRENVLGLTVVLADGRVIRTGGRARKSSAGYDLTRLFVGSEGTLGIIAEVTLKLARTPESVSAAVCPFPNMASAIAAAREVLLAGVPLARVELLDEVQMEAVNRYSSLDYAATPTLFFEFHGTAAAVLEQTQVARRIVEQHKGGPFRWAVDKADRDRLWRARYDAYYATLALRPGGSGFVTDVCVPLSELEKSILHAKELLKKTAIPAPLFGHVGDGNFHVVFVIDPKNPAELAEVQAINRKLVADALRRGGTCTGEHGIGLGKLDALEAEHGEGVAVMRAIKAALDPHNLMNPGKVLRMG